MTQEMELCVPDTRRDQKLAGQELGMILNAFLRTLSPENRVVFLRRYWYSAVQMRLRRTRAMLCTYLEKEGVRV